MKFKYQIRTGFLLFSIIAGLFLAHGYVLGDDNNSVPPELKAQIDKKNQELQAISQQIKDTQTQLDSTRDQKQSLQQELNQVNSQLNQLNLGIKSSQISVEKLGLEIDATQYNIKDSEEKISDKRTAIAELVRQIQQKDDSGNFLMIFLKNKSLADSISEIQGMVSLQNKLTVDIADLKSFKEDLNSSLSTATDKKKQKELEAENLKNRKIIVDETKKDRQTILTETKNKEKTYQQSLTDLQKKQEEIAQEIENLDAEARKGINTNLLPTSGPGVLALPVDGPLTQGYGATSFAQRGGYKGKWHNGIDIGAPVGTPVFAAEKGRVTAVANQDRYCSHGAYGKFITISHDNNLTTLYGHLSLQVVTEGQVVNRGDLIGYTGMTGYTTGPHLHFGVYASPTFKIGPSNFCGPKMPYGGDLNPRNYVQI